MAIAAASYIRRANYYETDKMGIVHHSNYIRWFEEARLEFMRQTGLRYEDMESDGILMPVTEVTCQYKYSIHFGEQAEIRTKLVYFNGVRASFGYEIYSLDSGRLAAVGESGHCFVDEHTRRPLNLKRRYPDFYQEALRVMNETQGACEEGVT